MFVASIVKIKTIDKDVLDSMATHNYCYLMAAVSVVLHLAVLLRIL